MEDLFILLLEKNNKMIYNYRLHYVKMNYA
jgi:hypothetical protein